MRIENLHPHLKRLISKFFQDRNLEDDEQLSMFINMINKTYHDYERDIKLFERASQLNDNEYNEINQKLKHELTLRDSIEKELRKEKLNAEKANEAKSHFLSVVSHEIRTPLNAIIGSTYLIEKSNSNNLINDEIEILKFSSNNLLLLINDLLDYNKIEAHKLTLEKTSFSLSILIKNILNSQEYQFQQNKNKITVNFDNKINYDVIGDPLRLSQILINLLSNASKFAKNKEIEISVKEKNNIVSQSTILFEIKDYGIGIDEKNLEKIFEPFEQEESKTTRKYGGTGLGLVITKKLLKLYNSEIHVISQKNKGATFYFDLTLPIDKRGITSNESDINDTLIKFENKKILIVEDNIINIKILSKILESWNLTFDVAYNGEEGYELFLKNAYDLILMDLTMPVMDGFESTVLIRKKDLHIPIIALSASNYVNEINLAKSLGFSDYVVKPFNVNVLNAKINQFLNP